MKLILTIDADIKEYFEGRAVGSLQSSCQEAPTREYRIPRRVAPVVAPISNQSRHREKGIEPRDLLEVRVEKEL